MNFNFKNERKKSNKIEFILLAFLNFNDAAPILINCVFFHTQFEHNRRQ